MCEKVLDFVFNEVSLYTKEVFKVFELNNSKYELNKNELSRLRVYLGIDTDKIITYCHKCKKEFPFKYSTQCFTVCDNKRISCGGLYILNKSKNLHNAYIDIKEWYLFGAQPPYEKADFIDSAIWYFLYCFTCTNNEHHMYMMMVSLEFSDGEFIVRKIGQNPSMLTVKGFDFDKYKDVLKEINAYDDYKKADLSFADHFYVGAYAYLRRIFEKLVNKYLEGIQISDDRMDTKINATRERFSPRIRDLLSNLYGILSISIHQLDEEQSKEYYLYLKAIIDIQLEYEKTEREKEKQAKSLESVLGRIKSQLSKQH